MMTQTKFDRWLIENFVYEHHIKVARLPEQLMSGIKVTELKSQQYHYLLTIKNRKTAEKCIQALTDAGYVFKTKIAEGSHWYNPIIFNKNKSFSYRLFWWTLILVVGFLCYVELMKFLESDFYFELKDHVLEVLLKK